MRVETTRRASAGGALAVATLLALWASGPAAGERGSRAEALVRSQYFEGLPYDEAREVASDDLPRLAELLLQPGERAHHGRIALVLGIRGGPGAYDALAAFAAQPVVSEAGEVGAAGYNAQVSLLLAMGHLAQRDDRALAFLLERVHSDTLPGWRYLRLRDAHLAEILRARAIDALGISGRAEAARALQALQAWQLAAPEIAQRCRHALALNARVAREGAVAVFGARPAR